MGVLILDGELLRPGALISIPFLLPLLLGPIAILSKS